MSWLRRSCLVFLSSSGTKNALQKSQVSSDSVDETTDDTQSFDASASQQSSHLHPSSSFYDIAISTTNTPQSSLPGSPRESTSLSGSYCFPKGKFLRSSPVRMAQ